MDGWMDGWMDGFAPQALLSPVSWTVLLNQRRGTRTLSHWRGPTSIEPRRGGEVRWVAVYIITAHRIRHKWYIHHKYMYLYPANGSTHHSTAQRDVT